MATKNRKARRMIEEELATGKSEWYWLSFAGEEGFRGACIVKACGPIDAVAQSHRLGINPGGEVIILDIERQEIVRPEMTHRLLSREKMEDLGLKLIPLKEMLDE